MSFFLMLSPTKRKIAVEATKRGPTIIPASSNSLAFIVSSAPSLRHGSSKPWISLVPLPGNKKMNKSSIYCPSVIQANMQRFFQTNSNHHHPSGQQLEPRRRQRLRSSSGDNSLPEGQDNTIIADSNKENSTSARKKTKSKKKSKVPLYRADRVLANRSGKTRSECFKLLQRQAISIVEEKNDGNNHRNNNDVSTLPLRTLRGPKERIPMTARIFINHKFEVPSMPPLLTVFHKPKWVLSTMGEDSKQRRNLQNVSFPFKAQMHPVGRLDYDSSGLLLFSSSGALTQTLLHPKFEKEKEYVAVVVGSVQEDELRAKLQVGVELVDVSPAAKKERKATIAMTEESGDLLDSSEAYYYDSSSDEEAEELGKLTNPPQQQSKKTNNPTFTTRAALLQVQQWPRDRVIPYLENIRSTLPPEYNVTDLKLRGYLDVFDAEELSEIRLVVQEGKHRMVRRMLATCGHPVVSLKRERIGVIELGGLKEGSFRNLTATEEAWAQSLIEDSEPQ